ncbi:hypothetical protein ENUP19_0252G0098 [Entamoeba nuttalli]|uniref:TLDc domain-containing protein n=2 Tax=Entamoeba nuttalli TaxID=412467 RepID=K2GT44_ENTNP|nr:hypothetical protein ENU1_211770 [Entamoeba nuttalli P19]EKE37032.1 hypothetical protein ENU1_211770 [Entamoeba nuttalli P19]|eukprot:XP_008860635.1 hypothetical protein ENU1_211770 [Entamoeba nuttalli P19]
MGNQSSIHYSIRSSRSGSISNPKEFKPIGRIESKHSHQNVINDEYLNGNSAICFATPRRDLRSNSMGKKNKSSCISGDLSYPIQPIGRSSSFSKAHYLKENDSEVHVLSPKQSGTPILITKDDLRSPKKNKKFLVPTLSIPINTNNRSQQSHSPRSLFSPISILSPKTLFSPRTPKSLRSSGTNSPVELCEGLSFEEKAEFFVNELGFNDFKIIYDSYIEELDTRTFNEYVLYQPNIILILILDDCQFGVYQNQPLINNKYTSFINDSDNCIIFSFKANKKEPIIITRKSLETKTITTYPNTEKQFIFTMYSAFWLTTDGKVTFHQMIRKSYSIQPQVLNPFHEKTLSEKSNCNRLVVLKLLQEEKCL